MSFLNEQPFIDAVRSNPDDDAPRWIFADWLEEHGHHKRAEFIRNSIQLANGVDSNDMPLTDEHKKKLEAAIAPRLKEERSRWNQLICTNEGAVYPGQATAILYPTFDRGLPCGLSVGLHEVDPKTLIAALRSAPITSLTLWDNALLNNFADCPETKSITTLILNGNKLPELKPLLSTSSFSGLTGITLSSANKETLKGLINAQSLTNLTSLECISTRLEADAIAEAMSLPNANRFKRLRFAGNFLGNAGLNSIATSPNLKSLRELDVSNCDITGWGIGALAKSPLFGQLSKLDLSMNFFGDDNFTHFIRTGNTDSLTYLNVGACSLTSASASALAHTDHLKALSALVLSGNHILDDGVLAVTQSDKLPALTKLDICDTGLTSDGLIKLVETSTLERLTSLGLSCNYLINDRGIVALARSEKIRNLTEMRVADCALSDTAAIAIAKSPFLGNLRTLTLHGFSNDITDKGMRALANSKTLNRNLAITVGDFSGTLDELKERLAQPKRSQTTAWSR